MSLNIIDLIKGQLGPALVSQAATNLGESESGISKAISGLLPAVVGGLANNASNPTVLDALTNTNNTGMLGNLMGGTANNSVISTILSAIFGDKVGGIVNAISSYAGIGNSSSSSLLNMVTGATLGSVGKYAADNNLDRSGISSLLGDQKGIVSTLLPAGLSLASLGLGTWFGGDDKINVSENARTATGNVHNTEPKVDVHRAGETHVNVDRNDNEGGGSIWKWLLPLILLVGISYLLWKQCDKKETTDTTVVTDSTDVVTTDTTAIITDTTAATTTVGTNRTATDIDLNGTPIRGYAGGMESRIIDFLKSDGYRSAADDAALKNTWYNFDNVNFEFGKSDVITPESVGQLENLAAILKAYPESKIKIGGYTDRKGDDAANKKLSQDRADYIKRRLTDLGVGAQVIGAEGYGEQFATVAETATDQEREADRRMAVRFAK